jgi:predicted nucleotidyltransferase
VRHRTGFPELDGVLDRLVAEAARVLGADLVGVYLVGSFALGDADEHSDVDVLVPVARPLTAAQETGLRALHADLPAAEGHWNRELEGSYPPVDELRTLGALGRPWLYVDRGSSVMEESPHCNTLEHRWTLRHRGVALAGPPPAAVVDDLPPGALREDMRRQIPGLLDAMRPWIDIERVAWGQRYTVATLCRMLYSVATDAVASKRASMLWAARELAPEWRPLIEAALAGRAIGWDPDDAPSAEAVAQTERFAEYAARGAADLWTRL